VKIYIGSSKEGIYYAERLKAIIKDLGSEPMLWSDTDEGIFIAGNTHIEDLERAAQTADAAVFLFRQDDETEIRGEKKPTVRANVLFEYGMFLGRLSRRRVCIVTVGKPDIASDFAGIKHINMKPEEIMPPCLSDQETGSVRKELNAWLLTNVAPLIKNGGADGAAGSPPLVMRSSLASLDEHLESVRSDLFISGVTLSSVFGNRMTAIIGCAERGVHIRLLYVNPKNDILKQAYKDLRGSKRDETQLSEMQIEEYSRSKNNGNIEIRFADFLMPVFFVAGDLKTGGGFIRAAHAFYDTKSSERPMVYVTGETPEWYKRYGDQIERVWDHAESPGETEQC
jgi:hypothetical protein